MLLSSLERVIEWYNIYTGRHLIIYGNTLRALADS